MFNVLIILKCVLKCLYNILKVRNLFIFLFLIFLYFLNIFIVDVVNSYDLVYLKVV